MPSVTYTAQRSIIPLSFLVSDKTDISASTLGSPFVNSYKSVSTDLSGLKTNEWIKVSGFTNAINNGWYQLAIDSVTNTITLITINNDAFINEAAGNSITIDGYLHGKGANYSLDLRFRSDNRQRQVIKYNSQALDGNTETIVQDRINYYDINSGVIIPNVYRSMIEFLDSCESNEQFTFDRDGSIAIPVDPLAAVLEDEGYTEERIGISDRGFSFRVRLL